MLDDDDITDEATRRLNDALGTGAPIDPADWRACRNGSLMLALAERRASRREYLRAAAACARAALPVRSTPQPALERALAVVEACADGEADRRAAREAAGWAYSLVSRMVAGIDDDVGLAVTEACDLAGGDRFELYGPDPAFRTAWAHASREHDPTIDRDATQRAYHACQATLADVVRGACPVLV